MTNNSDENVDTRDVINKVANEVNTVLNQRTEERYFDKIVLLYSFIENILKWLVYIKVHWEKASVVREMSDKEFDSIERFCKNLSFYNSLQIALLIDLVDFDLYQKIDEVRHHRNDMIHQLWMYRHRSDPVELRIRLENLAGVADKLIGISKKLTREIGVDEAWQMVLEKPRG